MPFTSLGLSTALLRAVAEQGYAQPTPIQSQAIPAVLGGRDLLAAAQTGTGKTAAFTLPLLQRLTDAPQAADRPSAGRAPRVLVLVPTRELAAQVSESVRLYGRYTQVRAAVVFGGVGLQPQIDALRRGIDILIATPGRLLDLIKQRHASLAKIEVLVLDEADRMLDMGFIHDIKRILGLLPKTRQNLLFSATFSDEIRELSGAFLHDPLSIDVAPRNAPATRVSQSVCHTPKADKPALLARLLGEEGRGQTLVFARTKHGANRLADQLGEGGFRVAVIHGNKSQSARAKALGDFKANRVQVLVATDIAARGIDIHQLPHVVNYELPNVPADYVHRIGRTGRAGAEGEAISLVSADEAPQLRDIERLLGRKLPFHPLSAAAQAGGKAEPSVHRAPPRPKSGRRGAAATRSPAAPRFLS
ncbi:DEAD/DEAH box helicase [Methylococcus sp. EFPC2]|uniref:DEAD/DEAH box helicase n=1 Tax=Methylococcus sp. EFPC2 TaxID=2812648 RepID=UPI0019674841|nr:DEAD/DEAH box helicase [Methylococcus sp. EFPC2]QSA97665.1 DEAD/DEAH box helicase [Methylococcus sp. EFPC2]